MRYTPKQLEAIRNNTIVGKPDPTLGIDPVAYAMDLFFIDSWLAKNLSLDSVETYANLHWRSRMDFAVVLLREFYSSNWSAEDHSYCHWELMERFLNDHNSMDTEDDNSLLTLLAHV